MTIDESLQQLKECSEIGENLLTTDDISNIWETIKSYQGELAIQDSDIDMYKKQVSVLEETVSIYKEIANGYEKEYRNIKG